jgi:hypothetical protein
LRATRRGSVGEEGICEVLDELVGGRSDESVRTVHHCLLIDTVGDDVARGDSLEVQLVVGRHHSEGLPHAQVKGAAHALGDMPAEGA